MFQDGQNNGFPAKRRYKFVIGEDMNTLVIERQWDCMAVMESTYEKMMVMPEYQALGQELESMVEYSKTEILMPLP